MYVLNMIKKHILHQNYLGTLKHSKQKSIENFPIFFSTVYRVHGAVVCRNFSPIGEYSSTVTNWQK
jgi:hypothetical protein